MMEGHRNVPGRIGVEDVQGMLNQARKKGAEPLETDGVFGPKMEAAVRDFQAERLEVDGIVGPKALAALREQKETGEAEETDEVEGTEEVEETEEANGPNLDGLPEDVQTLARSQSLSTPAMLARRRSLRASQSLLDSRN